MESLPLPFYPVLAAGVAACVAYLFYLAVLEPQWNPLRRLPGPPVRSFFGNHMGLVLDPSRSPRVHEAFVKHYGRNLRIRGFLPWDQRLFTLDPVSLAHILKHSTTYEKPWQSRALISSLIGVGMLAAEGHMHKRQRRVSTPAFSVQNMRALVPVTFQKGVELRDRWLALIAEVRSGAEAGTQGARLDVCHWVSRATFDVIGLAGFDYEFNAIHDESNELFAAYKEMFEIAVSQQGGGLWELAIVYAPILDRFAPGPRYAVVKKSQEVIKRVAGRLIQEKKRKIEEAEKAGSIYGGKDLLSALLRSNAAADLPPDQRISDEDILHNINTFMFAGSDTSSLSVTWILYLLSVYPDVQTRLRAELLSIAPTVPLESLTQDEIASLYTKIAELPYLENIIRETLRLIPPVHSSIRVATQDDVVPTSTLVKLSTPDGGYEEADSFLMPKGSCVHVPIEAFNLDREVWGPDGWQFKPDRWDNLPEAVKAQPGLYNNILTFSAGPRSCIGVKFSIIEIKMFMFILVTNFKFAECDKVGKANVVLTRPYIMGKHREGSQCPLLVIPYTPETPA
ncbi:cytochrome-450 hydroxylase [Dichomitus squalens LYAD-421 SS1]|uniref:Cytochrome-450 hydroxylase n=1 Tax=Dichomitus squalens (strain LYAD-421) TaxID=732165 RepID=R7SI77_DICSQ|nr:cytochrome-450 hydroxylase [Dichomitus squalens LYAD-421 SS1]EJF55866.1 cytochrome-450 hydroxylase [Dichomitus squalens LYAD-421 SS1]